MARFLISHRRAGKRHRHEHHRAREAMTEAMNGPVLANADIHAINRPASDHARHVAMFEADHGEVQAHAWHPDLLVEQPLDHHPGRVRPPEVGRADAEELAAGTGTGKELVIRVTCSDGRPAADIDVFVYLEDESGPKQLARRPDASGEVRIHCDPGSRVTHVAAVPHDGYWPLIADQPADQLEFELDSLPPAERHLGWWHRALGISRFATTRGRGIRVGVIDTGIGPHPALAHVHDLGSLVDGQHDASGGADLRGHGSHVSGLIAARPESPGQYGGLAPGATVYSIRVFGDTGAAHQGDIALALYELAHEKHCHLVNLSLGTTRRSEIELDAIVDAAAHGCLTISAAGNTAGALEYPAAFAEAVAVTALGREGWGPPGTLPAHRRPSREDWYGPDGFYLANFCCTGDGVNFTAPGVGIISTVPGGWAAFGGTSMAAPQVTGLLAALLSRDTDYKGRAADAGRTRAAREILLRHCRDLGLAPELQGDGLPVYPRFR